MDTPPTDTDERIWEDGWEGHELEQLRRLARLSLPEKLAWLEDAHQLVLELQDEASTPSSPRP